MGEIFAILSGKGGTGKTSVCAGVSTALANQGLRVLCIDCDVGLRNLDISLGIPDSSALSFWDVCEGGYSLENAPRHPSYPTLSFLTAPMNRAIESIDLQPFTAMLRQAKQEFDFIFLDAPAGVDAGFRLAAVPGERFLLVTGAGPAAIRDATRVADLLQLMGKQDVRLIVNRVRKDMLRTVQVTIDDVMDTAGLPLGGIVPEDPQVTLAAAFGCPLLRYAPRCPAVRSFRAIAKRIQGYSAPIAFR